MDRKHLESLIEEGLSTYKIAERVGKGQTTVRYWIRKYDLEDKYKTTKRHQERKVKGSLTRKLIYTCGKCKITLNKENAYYKGDVYHSYCKECLATITFEKRVKFKKKALEYRGNSCKNCGYDKNLTALEFHHLDQSQKEITPSKLHSKTWENAKTEFDKCVVLCTNCHREEHHRLDTNKKLGDAFTSILTSSFSDKILTGRNTGQRSCLTCDIVLTDENKAVGPHGARCKSCYSKKIIENTVEAKQRAVDYMGGCCSVCGYYKCIRSIEFHHLDPSLKSETYNRRFTSWGFERQKKELENCIIVCANCHREIHSADEHQMPLTEPDS